MSRGCEIIRSIIDSGRFFFFQWGVLKVLRLFIYGRIDSVAVKGFVQQSDREVNGRNSSQGSPDDPHSLNNSPLGVTTAFQEIYGQSRAFIQNFPNLRRREHPRYMSRLLQSASFAYTRNQRLLREPWDSSLQSILNLSFSGFKIRQPLLNTIGQIPLLCP